MEAELRTPSIEQLLDRTPYLVADGDAARVRFAGVAAKALATHARAIAASRVISQHADELLGPYESAMRSDLVAESNQMDGYTWTSTEVRDLVRLRRNLLEIELNNFIESMRADPHLWEALGLFRAYAIADDWAKGEERPREFEIRSLHAVVMTNDPCAGRYKRAPNEIGGSEHTPTAPWDVPDAMRELTEWFAAGSGDPLLDAAVAHAWLTHIHPFDDGNGRMARLLANLALVQAGFPPLLLRSRADRGQYLDALAASDEGDILPLYDLFSKSLRRMVAAMERPDYVQRKIRLELLRTVQKRYVMWLELVKNLFDSLSVKASVAGWSIQLMGYPTDDDFALLERRSRVGSCWFIKLRRGGQDRWLLWFGYQSRTLVDLLGGRESECWPSIFISRPNSDPREVHPWQPIFEPDGSDVPNEITVTPATRKQVTLRHGLQTQDYDLVDGTSLLAKALLR